MTVAPTVYPQTDSDSPAQPVAKTISDSLGQAGGDEAEEGPEDGGNNGQALSASQVTRQNRIMEFLKEKGDAQVWEIQEIFPGVSKRTIRRDFVSLLKQGLIERTGERNTTAYRLRINVS